MSMSELSKEGRDKLRREIQERTTREANRDNCCECKYDNDTSLVTTPCEEHKYTLPFLDALDAKDAEIAGLKFGYYALQRKLDDDQAAYGQREAKLRERIERLVYHVAAHASKGCVACSDTLLAADAAAQEDKQG